MTSSIVDYEQAVDQIFQLYDRNRDNYLEVYEVMALFKDGAESIGKHDISTDEFERFLRILDKNKDGKVSRRELLNFIKIFSSLVSCET